MKSKLMITCSIALAVLSQPTITSAADFYSGKTIKLIVGSDVGGGFDVVARLISQHLGRFIPGGPTVVVENMPGAGSGIAASYVFAKAPKDGTVIGALNPGGLLAPFFEERSAAFDPSKFQYLGSSDSSARLCISLKESRVKTFKDAQAQPTVVGAGAVGSSSFDYAYLHRAVHGGKFNIVPGYKGMADIMLAMERKEVEVICGYDWSSIKASRPDMVRDGRFNYLLKVAVKPEPELEPFNVPDADSFAATDHLRAVGRLVGSQQIFGRPYVVAPGVPEDRLELLRKAFADALSDPAFLSDSERVKVAVSAASGSQVQTAIVRMYSAPLDVLQDARKAIRP